MVEKRPVFWFFTKVQYRRGMPFYGRQNPKGSIPSDGTNFFLTVGYLKSENSNPGI